MVNLKNIHAKLKQGELPAYLYILDWSDITQFENLDVGAEGNLFRFHSAGCVIKVAKDKIDLQQTWEVGTDPTISAKTANVLLSLPKGVIQNIYVYRLVGKFDDVKKKMKKVK